MDVVEKLIELLSNPASGKSVVIAFMLGLLTGWGFAIRYAKRKMANLKFCPNPGCRLKQMKLTKAQFDGDWFICPKCDHAQFFKKS